MSAHSVIVVGASSGVGAALAMRFAAEGRPVAILGRRQDRLNSVCEETKKATPQAVIRSYPHDVMDFGAVSTLFDRIESDLGSADTLIYAAGVLPKVGPEEFNTEKDLSIVQIGLTGALAWLNEAANRFTKAGGGTICGISSIAGERGRTGMPAYHAAKAGLSTFLESLYNRLWKKNIKVVTIKPGFLDTDMTKGMDGLFWHIKADRAADIIYKHMQAGRRCAYVLGRWSLVALVIRSIPSFIFKRTTI